MRRRELLGAIGAAMAVPFFAQAQQRIPRVGILWHAGSAEEEGSNFRALIKGFSDTGYIDGRTVALLHRFPSEEPAKFRAMASELAQSGVDVW